ncbi:hypothetical protein [Thermocrinis sp.]|uniref:hypothetical protein n=1 Tax=Thermocrinis sp. TaxID=2024383 RepID=UPI002FDF04EF
MRAIIVLLFALFIVHAREPFTDLEGVVGYIVVERKGKVENYLVVEGKDGGFRMVKVDKNPKQFLKKVEDESQKK